MKEIATLNVLAADSGDEALAIVRAGRGLVAVSLSSRSDGDVEIVFAPKAARELLDALRQALSIAEMAP